MFSVVAVCLAIAMSPSDAMCAEDDEIQISLPTKKDPKASSKQDSVLPRANEMLQGVVYDLKLTKDLKSTGNLSTASGWDSRVLNSKYTKILQQFVLGPWRKSVDAKGNIRYPELDEYYCSPTRVWNSCFYLEAVTHTEAPRLFACEDVVKSGGWVAIFSGYVVAPFTGKFRFVGLADDVILVRFNNKIVLDYGWFSCTMGTTFDSFGSNYKTVLGRSPSVKTSDAVSASPLYSKTPLSILPINYDGSQERGLQRGPVLEVKKGDVIPIEVLLSELGVGGFASMLFVERLDSSGEPMDKDPKALQLFRTTKHLPPHPKSDFPDFAENGPVWKVVDSFGKTIPASKNAKQDVKIAFPVEIAKPAEKTVGTASDKAVEKTEKTGTVSSGTQASEQTKKTEPVASAQPQYEETLPGVIYDLGQTAGRRATDLLELQENPSTDHDYNAVPVLKKFVLDDWQRRVDVKGNISYPGLNQFYRSPTLLKKPYFYQPSASTAVMIRDRFGEKNITDRGWLIVHSGYVVAPFTGKFRFVGTADDVLVIRFDRQIVLDYGFFSLTLGKYLPSGASDYRSFLTTRSHGRLLPEKDIYSGKLEIGLTGELGTRGAAKSVPINVVKGRAYPIDILYTDFCGGSSYLLVMIEQLDSSGNPIQKAAKLPLFRTSSELPAHPGSTSFPDFVDSSPIWKVVDANGRPIPARTKTSPEAKQEKPATSTSSAAKPATSTSTSTSSAAKPATSSTTNTAAGTTKATTTPKTTKMNPFGTVERSLEEDE